LKDAGAANPRGVWFQRGNASGFGESPMGESPVVGVGIKFFFQGLQRDHIQVKRVGFWGFDPHICFVWLEGGKATSKLGGGGGGKSWAWNPHRRPNVVCGFFFEVVSFAKHGAQGGFFMGD